MPNIVDFIEHRLTDEERAAASMPDMQKALRMNDALRAACSPIVANLEANDLDPEDNPLAAGLLVVANIWSDHPDFTPRLWFPTMIARFEKEVQR